MMSIQGGLQGRIDTRIYQRKKIGPSPEDPRPEAQRIGPKLEPQRLQIPFILKMFFFSWVNFFFFFFTFFFLTYATFLRAQNFSVFL